LPLPLSNPITLSSYGKLQGSGVGCSVSGVHEPGALFPAWVQSAPASRPVSAGILSGQDNRDPQFTADIHRLTDKGWVRVTRRVFLEEVDYTESNDTMKDKLLIGKD
jgi:hypothetical protein